MSDSASMISLEQALRALPPTLPERSEWQRMHAVLAAEQQQRAIRQRRRRLWALAAMLALVALLPRWMAEPPPLPPAAVAAVDSDPLRALQEESARLDAVLAVSRQAQVQDAANASLSGQIIDRVQWIDATLGQTLGAEAEQALWQERVELLRRLALIESREQWFAAAADADSSAPLLML